MSAPLDWEVVDAVPGAADPAVAAAEFRRPFDLSAPSPMRFRLLRRSATRHELIFTAHHIIIDGWSAPLFFREVMEIYEADGDASTSGPGAVPRVHRVARERSRDRSLARWRERLGRGRRRATSPPRRPRVTRRRATPPTAPVPPTAPRAGARDRRGGARDRRDEGAHRLVPRAPRDGEHGDAVRVGRRPRCAHRPRRRRHRHGGVRPAAGGAGDRVDGRDVHQHGPGAGAVAAGDDAASQVEALHRDVTEMREHEYVGLADIQRQAGQRDLFDTLVVYQNTPGGDDGVRTTSQGVRVTPLRTADSTHYPFTLVPAVVDGRLTVRGEYREDDAGRTGLPVRPERIVRAVTALLETLPLSDGTALARLGTGFGAGDGDGDGGDGDGGAGGGRTGATSPTRPALTRPAPTRAPSPRSTGGSPRSSPRTRTPPPCATGRRCSPAPDCGTVRDASPPGSARSACGRATGWASASRAASVPSRASWGVCAPGRSSCTRTSPPPPTTAGVCSPARASAPC